MKRVNLDRTEKGEFGYWWKNECKYSIDFEDNYDELLNNNKFDCFLLKTFKNDENHELRLKSKLRFEQISKKIGFDFISINSQKDYVKPLMSFFKNRSKRY